MRDVQNPCPQIEYLINKVVYESVIELCFLASAVKYMSRFFLGVLSNTIRTHHTVLD